MLLDNNCKMLHIIIRWNFKNIWLCPSFVPTTYGFFFYFNMPSSCVQELRPLLATVIRIGSGLPARSPGLAGLMHFAAGELWLSWGGAVGSAVDSSSNFSHAVPTAGLMEVRDAGLKVPGIAGSPQSRSERSRVIYSVEMCFSWRCLVTGVRWRERGVVRSHIPYQGEVP